MWRLIEDSSIIHGIFIGQIITKNPDNPIDQYKISFIHLGYVRAVHCNGRSSVKVFPEEELVSEKWWVKE